MKSIRDFLKNVWWVLKFGYKADPLLSTFDIILTISSEVLPILSSYVKSMLFTTIVAILVQRLTFPESIPMLTPVAIYLVLTEIVFAIIGQLSWSVSNRLGYKQRTYTEERYIEKLIQLDTQQFESPDVANTVKKTEDNIWKVYSVNKDLLTYIARITGGITSFVILAKYNPLLIIVGIILSIPSPVTDSVFNRASRKIYDDNTEKWREYWHARWFLTVKDALLEIKVLTIAKKIYRDIFSFRKENDQARFDLIKKFDLISLFVKTNEFYYIFGLGIIIKDTITKAGTIGDISFYSDQVGRVSTFLTNTLKNFVNIYDSINYLVPVKTFFELENAIKDGTTRLELITPPKIEFRNVSFKYPKSEKFTLKNISVVINPNEEIAIVGENGAGKSTFIKLLLRLYEPTEGDIFINDINIKEISIQSYYECIGALFQEYYYLGYKTVRENIAYSKSRFSNITVEQAAKMADMNETIKALPNGYETISISDFEGGVNLSRGQSQKLVIARLFYRNAPILILDEPTASIDAVSESKIFNRIYKFMDNKTVIIISHRFSTVRNAQRILVFNKGEIIEQGSHKELIELGGVYYKSFKLQAEGYTNED